MARMSKSIELKIAFNPLNDAALIVVAEALGFYESEGLDVTLMREANWSTVRDKLAYGLADAAHILAPVPFAAALGLGPSVGRVIAPMALGANGNAFLVSSAAARPVKARSSSPYPSPIRRTISCCATGSPRPASTLNARSAGSCCRRRAWCR